MVLALERKALVVLLAVVLELVFECFLEPLVVEQALVASLDLQLPLHHLEPYLFRRKALELEAHFLELL